MLFKVEEDYGAGVEVSSAGDIFRRDVQDAGLGGQNEKSVFPQGPAGGPEAVPVQGRAGRDAVGEGQGGGAVPGFHQRGVVFVEGSDVMPHMILRAPGLGHEHQYGVGGIVAGIDEELEDVVEAEGVRGAFTKERQDFLKIVSQKRGTKRGKPGSHGVQVSLDGVDFAVVGQKPERMGQFPAGEGVGGETLVDKDQGSLKLLVREVGIEFLQLRRDEKTFVDDSARREGAEEGALAFLFQHSSQNEEFSLQFLSVADGIKSYEKLLYSRHAGSRHCAYGLGLYGDVAPAEDSVAVLIKHALYERFFVLLFEDHGHGVLAERRKARDLFF